MTTVMVLGESMGPWSCGQGRAMARPGEDPWPPRVVSGSELTLLTPLVLFAPDIGLFSSWWIYEIWSGPLPVALASDTLGHVAPAYLAGYR